MVLSIHVAFGKVLSVNVAFGRVLSTDVAFGKVLSTTGITSIGQVLSGGKITALSPRDGAHEMTSKHDSEHGGWIVVGCLVVSLWESVLMNLARHFSVARLFICI